MLPTNPLEAIEAILNTNINKVNTSLDMRFAATTHGLSVATSFDVEPLFENIGNENTIPSPIAIHTEGSMKGNGAVRLYGIVETGVPKPNNRPKNLTAYEGVADLKNTQPSMMMDKVYKCLTGFHIFFNRLDKNPDSKPIAKP